MNSLHYLRVIEGERISNQTCSISNEQVVFEGGEIEVSVFKNNKWRNKKFELQVQMPWGNLYSLERYENQREALEAMGRLVRKLQTNKVRIMYTKQRRCIIQKI